MAPTATSVSRQALFAGRPPTAFTETLTQTNQDGDRWETFSLDFPIKPLPVGGRPG